MQLGQTVKVVILKIDREKRKLSLGLKQLQPSPWDNINDKYPAGSRVKGKVTRIENFGAFVELEPAVEGLIHISELSPSRVRRVIDIVKPGQEVEVVVVSVDPGAAAHRPVAEGGLAQGSGAAGDAGRGAGGRRAAAQAAGADDAAARWDRWRRAALQHAAEGRTAVTLVS